MNTSLRQLFRKACSLFLCVVMILPLISTTNARAEEPDETGAALVLYVSAEGNDQTGDGTPEAPYASLGKTAQVANAAEEKTIDIRILSDLTSTACARFYNKDVSMTSEGGTFTVTRGVGFDTISDNARSWYNPAMIEIQTTTEGASLFVTNLVLDDAGIKAASSLTAQTDNGSGGNDTKAQSAIIESNAIYPTVITLGEGAVLKNFGGMSAVRVTAEASLVMQAGSLICDDDNHGEGGFGAVWAQSADVTMLPGSCICGICRSNGAISLDGTSNAWIDGEICHLNGKVQNAVRTSGVLWVQPRISV